MKRVFAWIVVVMVSAWNHEAACAGDALVDNKTNRISFSVTGMKLESFIENIGRATGVNLFSSGDLEDLKVTASLDDVAWMPALRSVLALHGYEIVEYYPGSELYWIRDEGRNYGRETVIFHEHGTAKSTNRVTFSVTNAMPSFIIMEIARQAKINIAFERYYSEEGLTIDVEDLDYERALQLVANELSCAVYWSFFGDCYVVAARPGSSSSLGYDPFYYSIDDYNPITDGDGWLRVHPDILGFLAVALIILLIWQRVCEHLRLELDELPASGVWKKKAGRSLFWFCLGGLSVVCGITMGGRLILERRILVHDWTGIGLALTLGALCSFSVFLLLERLVTLLQRRTIFGRAQAVFLWGIIVFPLVLVCRDSAPLKGDYTWADVPVPAERAEESYACFQQLIGTNTVEGGISNRPVALGAMLLNPLKYSREIEEAWQAIEPARKVVEQLHPFDFIGDQRSRDDVVSETSLYQGLRDVAHGYQSYALLSAARGDVQEAVRQLGVLHSVIRKALPYSCTIRKDVLLSIADENIEVAHYIAGVTNCPTDILESLRKTFSGLTQDEISFEIPILAEYLVQKERCQTGILNEEFLDILQKEERDNEYKNYGEEESEEVEESSVSPWRKRKSWMAAVLGFKRNRTIRDIRTYYELLLEGAREEVPSYRSALQWRNAYQLAPRLSNWGGWRYGGLHMDGWLACAQGEGIAVKVKNDLLAMELNHLLGQPLLLHDFRTGRSMHANKSKRFYFSPGWDDRVGSYDDIVLGFLSPVPPARAEGMKRKFLF